MRETTAGERFRFKKRTCEKKCGLWEGKGGFCPAKRDNIEFCLTISIEESYNFDYRNIDNVIEWLEEFSKDHGYLLFSPTPDHIQEIKTLLKDTNLDCYDIAEKVGARIWATKQKV
jgi:hypothetical protein